MLSCTRALATLLGAALSLAIGLPATAGTISDLVIQVGVAGNEMTIDGDTLADLSDYVGENEETGTVTISDGSFSNGSWTLTWDTLQFNPDPFVTFVGGFTNLMAGATDFTLSISSPIAPIGPSTVIGGSTTVSVSDANFSGAATLQNSAGLAGYSGTLDGADVLDLLDPFGISAPFQGGTASTTETLGLPGPTIPAGSATTSLGITHRFNLSGNDSATFNSTFIVELAVPEPATALLVVTALAGLALRGRRSAA